MALLDSLKKVEEYHKGPICVAIKQKLEQLPVPDQLKEQDDQDIKKINLAKIMQI